MVWKILSNLFEFRKKLEQASGKKSYTPCYRVASIQQDKHGDYEIVVQLISTARAFTMKPEEILADDEMTDCFSPRDIRALTYLGYLDINAPKYKILAKRLIEKEQKIMFAILEKGKNSPILKTSEEISNDQELIKGLSSQDVHSVGYTTAAERHAKESEEKAKLLAEKEE